MNKYLLQILLSIVFSINVSSQIKLSSFGVLFGIQKSGMSDLNMQIIKQNQFLEKPFNNVNFFNNLSFSSGINFSKIKRITLHTSFDYLWHPKENNSFYYDSIYCKEYNFRISSFILSVVPKYTIILKERFRLETGIGLHYNITLLSQNGLLFNIDPNTYEITTTPTTSNQYKGCCSWLGNITSEIKVSKHFWVSIDAKYRRCIIYNMGNYNFLFHGVMYDCVPVSKTNFDFSGFSLNVGLLYRLE